MPISSDLLKRPYEEFESIQPMDRSASPEQSNTKRNHLTEQYILVTGGAGYVGSHVVLVLIEKGYKVVVLDNLCNSSQESLRRVEKLTNQPVPFVLGDLKEKESIRQVFQKFSIFAVIHVAGLKAVGESCSQPRAYYGTNLLGTFNLLCVMEDYHVHRLIYSSSATVYGDPEQIPIPETCPTAPTSPYGNTKCSSENMMLDFGKARPDVWKFLILRYFNPAGAHPSGQMGEDPRGVPNNLMPFMAHVALGKEPLVKVFGTDYKTRDGTGLRDYIHIMDLARGHMTALEKLETMQGTRIYNLGTGIGSTVLEMIQVFSKITGKKIPYQIDERRPGDVDILVADPSLAQKELQWSAKLSLDDMCQDLWRWVSSYPQGYLTPKENIPPGEAHSP